MLLIIHEHQEVLDLADMVDQRIASYVVFPRLQREDRRREPEAIERGKPLLHRFRRRLNSTRRTARKSSRKVGGN